MLTIHENTERITEAYPQRQPTVIRSSQIRVMSTRRRTSNRIPNLSFRWSIQTVHPDLRERIANVVESCDIRNTISGRLHISLGYDIHVDNSNGADEICAYDFDELQRPGSGKENPPAVYFIGVRITSKPCVPLRQRGANSRALLP